MSTRIESDTKSKPGPGTNHPFKVTVRTLAGYSDKVTIKPNDTIGEVTDNEVQHFIKKGWLTAGDYSLSLPQVSDNELDPSATFGCLDRAGCTAASYPPSSRPLRLFRAVGVAPVLDSEDHDFPLNLVDPVQHSIGASASGEDAREVAAQLLAHSLGILDEGANEELDDGRRHALGQARTDGPGRRRG